MIIGIPKEIKNREHRVALTPDGAHVLITDGHRIHIEQGAGTSSGFSDQNYAAAGASIVKQANAAWAADLVVKVKEPLPEEYDQLRPGLCLFTFLHLASNPNLLHALLTRKVCAIGYETVQYDDGSLPLLTPMSRIAGRLATQIGASLLQVENGTPWPGRGVLMGGINHVPAARVLILGGGNVGCNAAEVAIGMGAEVQVLDTSAACVGALRAHLDPTCDVRLFTPQLMLKTMHDCDLLIGAALIAGAHAPHLLTPDLLRRMPERAVFVDVAIDQGGISETSRPSSYDAPVYVEQGVLHCCLPNLPSAVPISSTHALTAATLPYIQLLANESVSESVREHKDLARGVNTCDGHIVHPALAAIFELT